MFWTNNFSSSAGVLVCCAFGKYIWLLQWYTFRPMLLWHKSYPTGSLLHSQDPPTCPNRKPDKSQCPPPHFLKIHFNIISTSMPGYHHRDRVCTSHLPHMCCMLHASHSSWFHFPNIWWLQILKCLIMYSYPLSHYHVHHRPKCLPKHSIPKHTQPVFLAHCGRPSFTPIQNKRQNYIFVYLDLYNFGHQTGRQKDSAPNNGKHSVTAVCT